MRIAAKHNHQMHKQFPWRQIDAAGQVCHGGSSPPSDPRKENK